MTEKWCYFFAAGESEGNIKMKEILGGKGAGLAEMASIGIPVLIFILPFYIIKIFIKITTIKINNIFF